MSGSGQNIFRALSLSKDATELLLDIRQCFLTNFNGLLPPRLVLLLVISLLRLGFLCLRLSVLLRLRFVGLLRFVRLGLVLLGLVCRGRGIFFLNIIADL